MRQGTFQWMKSVNKSIILNKIRTDAPISRAQIAKETKLTPPTVSSNVKELIDQGIVKESKLGESQGGRKPTMLLINNQGFYVVGVDAGPEIIECVLTDLSGENYKANFKYVDHTDNKCQVSDCIKRMYSQLFTRYISLLAKKLLVLVLQCMVLLTLKQVLHYLLLF